MKKHAIAGALWAVCLVANLYAAPSYAAIAELYGANRVGSFIATCSGNTCAVEIRRVRMLLPAYQAEADALGIEVSTIPEATRTGTMTRAQLNTCLDLVTLNPR